VALQVPPSPDYIPGLEELQSPPLIDFVLEPSPDYVPESDPEADPKEDDDEDPEEDPVDYPADGGDDEDESSMMRMMMRLTSRLMTRRRSTQLLPILRLISIPALVLTPVWSDAEVARLLAISIPPLSPLSPWSSPLPQIPSPPLPPIPYPSLPVSSPVRVLSPSPLASLIRPLSYRAAMIRLRAEAASTSHSLPLPPPIILSYTKKKLLGIALGPTYEVGESSSAVAARLAGGLRADYGFVATMDREIRRDPERDVGYGITDSWDEIVETLQGAPVSTDTELGRHMTAFETRVRDRHAHVRTARLMKTEARMSREAWGRSMNVSDLARAKVMSLCTTVLAQQSHIRELQSADRRRQTVITEMLAAYYRRQRQLTEALKLVKNL
ncbi:hypothetical protein Tco_0370658, partial [Tanacetum coccineum]